MELLWLPVRCPELNPLAALGRSGKQTICANRPYPTIDEVVERFWVYLYWLSPHETRRKAGLLSDHCWLNSSVWHVFWLPLSGGKERLLGISKRGDRYLRTLLIHGARATVHRARRKTDARSRGIMSVEQRRGKNIAAVAIANKNARIAWALLTSDAEYRKAA
jgi:hypothetical protein